ncbi:MAG: hypothetical protein QXS02_04900 [Candidatus Thermoplasmatota archaeon]
MINVTEDKHTPKPERNIVNLYSNLMRISLIIILLYTLWAIFVITSIYYLNLGYRWSILSMEEWFIIGCILYALTLVLEIICIIRITRLHEHKKTEVKNNTPTTLAEKKTIQDKTIWVYTYPEGAKGGVFSRTYIPLDDDSYLQLRIQLKTQNEI